MNNYWNSVDYVTLPVRLVDGRWELLYGGSTGVRDGAHGELRVAVSQIEDEAIRKRLTATVTVQVLTERAELLVALRDPGVTRLIGDNVGIHPGDLPAGCTRVERIRVGATTRATARIDPKQGGLWLRQRGVDRTDLLCSGVEMPDGFVPTGASSLNHACTLLSERYETHRISHTLNVYRHVFYQEPEDQRFRWHPLETLRNGVIAGMERSILADAWRQMERQLGWRPMPPAIKNKRKR